MADSASSRPHKGSKNIDLYALLELDRTASPTDIKKAYRKLALQHHPDKVPEDQRAESEIRFKAIKDAYEILSDEEKRELYDEHGMDAFDPNKGAGAAGADDMMNMFSQMFGMDIGGGASMRRPRKSPDQEQEYEVSLEELYRGKTVKFAAEKLALCLQCNGSGAKDKVKPSKCDRCGGDGRREVLRQAGIMIHRAIIPCDHCSGSGVYYKEKVRCKKCKGKCTVKKTKSLELYIPRGSMQGEKMVLEGEADEFPDQQPGDIIFHLVEKPHDIFNRIGPDLSASLNITLAEALCGFSRVVLTHLDGRGIHIDHQRGKILKPGEILKVPDEGMPLKRGEAKGDLYLTVKIEFPEAGWLKDDKSYEALQKLLPPPGPRIDCDEVDEVTYEDDVNIDEMGVHSKGARFTTEWEDEEQEGPQCATQ